MGYHTYDPDEADRLEDAARRYRYVSMDEVVGTVATQKGVVADLGSGTGFYADDVAPRVDTLYAVDVQEEMHELYREKGIPANVELVTADVADLPLGDDALDAAYSTMTYHEFASQDALKELRRVLSSGASLVLFDWSARGDGRHGPPTDERYTADEATESLRDAGFVIERSDERTETFAVLGVA